MKKYLYRVALFEFFPFCFAYLFDLLCTNHAALFFDPCTFLQKLPRVGLELNRSTNFTTAVLLTHSPWIESLLRDSVKRCLLFRDWRQMFFSFSESTEDGLFSCPYLPGLVF